MELVFAVSNHLETAGAGKATDTCPSGGDALQMTTG